MVFIFKKSLADALPQKEMRATQQSTVCMSVNKSNKKGNYKKVTEC